MLTLMVLAAVLGSTAIDAPPGGWVVTITYEVAMTCEHAGIETDPLATEAEAAAEADRISESGCWVDPSTNHCSSVRPENSNEKIGAGAIIHLAVRGLR